MKRAERANITSLRMGNVKGLSTIFISIGERITDANDVYPKYGCLKDGSEMANRKIKCKTRDRRPR